MTDLVEMSLVKVEKLDKDLLLAWSTVEHWLENWQDPPHAYIYADKCAYCKEYMGRSADTLRIYCPGCPVKERSGQDGCWGTPWQGIDGECLSYDEDDPWYEEAVEAMEAEYVYLVEIALDLTHRYQVREGLL